MRILTLLLFSSIAWPQQRPQFIWQGEVDGTDTLFLRNKRLEVRVGEGLPVQGQRYRFYDPLPDINQNVRLEVLKGRGYVHIVAQPDSANDYTLVVALEDRQPGSAPYSIALYWDASAQYFMRGAGHTEKLQWSGRVDQEATIDCRASGCDASSGRGLPVADAHFRFSRPLPKRDVDVRLDETHGRGEVRLVQQPRQNNNYTARVSIRDAAGGSGEYSFTLLWKRSSNSREPEPEYAGRGMLWSGVVDGKVRVTVQGGAAFSEVVQGHPVTGEHADFLRPLPSRSDLSPAVKRLLGRGTVEIVEVPSEKNNFRLVFEITDSPEGADRYEIEVDW